MVSETVSRLMIFLDGERWTKEKLERLVKGLPWERDGSISLGFLDEMADSTLFCYDLKDASERTSGLRKSAPEGN